MVRLAVLAAILAGLAVAGADYLDTVTSRAAANEPAAVEAAPVPAPPAAAARPERVVSFEADMRGHFSVEAAIDGTRIAMMVDTGATVVALRESDARRAGVFVVPNDFTTEIGTANGSLAAAPVTLREIAIGGIRFEDVEAIVLPDRALGANLLGMSFMRRLSRYEANGGRLILVE